MTHPALPDAFAQRMRRLLGEEADALLAALARPPVAGLRVNPREVDPAAFAAAAPWELAPVPWCPSGFVLQDERARPGLHPHHAAGLYYLQDPSAMAAAEALAPRPGERVLDLAAAPGGKSTHALSLMGDRGLLVANDVVGTRARALSQNLERWGARNVLVTSAPAETLAARWAGLFDRVLLDAPCSGEGMFRKSPEARAAWGEAEVRGSAVRQEELLAHAARLVRPGGTLVYSTCTFAPEENEGGVARLLRRRTDVGLEPLSLQGTSPGRPDWVPGAGPELAGAARIWPHLAAGDGHFVARLRRDPDAPAPTPPDPAQADLPAAPRAARDAWRAFAREALPADPFEGVPMTLHRDLLLALPEGLPPTRGVRLVRAGLPLGRVARGRFEPAHALARALRPDERGEVLSFAPDDPELAGYLAGLELERPGGDGWLLVAVDGHPLGWGRRARGVVKNRYPKGLRAR